MREKVSPAIQDSINFIDRLCEQDIIAYPIDYEPNYPSNKELSETFENWFGGNKWLQKGDSFVQFGQDGTGSLFLLWYYPLLKIEPPVVFMGSEGESYLVAPKIDDFIRQLASGKLFYDSEWFDPELEEQLELDWHRLRSVVEAKLGRIELTPLQIQNRAIKLHPNFTAWVEANIEY